MVPAALEALAIGEAIWGYTFSPQIACFRRMLIVLGKKDICAEIRIATKLPDVVFERRTGSRGGSMVVFSRCRHGGIDYGNIGPVAAKAIGGIPGPIRLPEGFPGPKGYGKLHVESNESRMRQLRGLDYSNFSDFAMDVAQNYQWIGDARAGRFSLVCRKSGCDLHLIVEQREFNGEAYWSIVTGVPSRVVRDTRLFEMRAGGCEPAPIAAEKQSRFETLTLPNKSGGRGS